MAMGNAHMNIKVNFIWPEMHYKSTACMHSMHSECRLMCKFCEEKCSCGCHTEEDNDRDAGKP